MYKIEKKVPIECQTRKTPFPFASLEIGDSFFVPAQDFNRRKVSNDVFYRNSTDGGKRYVTRTVEGGVRVWRVA